MYFVAFNGLVIHVNILFPPPPISRPQISRAFPIFCFLLCLSLTHRLSSIYVSRFGSKWGIVFYSIRQNTLKWFTEWYIFKRKWILKGFRVRIYDSTHLLNLFETHWKAFECFNSQKPATLQKDPSKFLTGLPFLFLSQFSPIKNGFSILKLKWKYTSQNHHLFQGSRKHPMNVLHMLAVEKGGEGQIQMG